MNEQGTLIGEGGKPENNGKRILNLEVPEKCWVCGLKTTEWFAEHPERPWLNVVLLPGIAIFRCPQCSVAFFNPNALENHKQIEGWRKEDDAKVLKVAKTIVDPITKRPLDLVRGGN